jgi:subtilase family serine protease
MNAAVISAVLVFGSFDPTVAPAWALIAGTSEATPLWAGTEAVMNQADGPPGFLAPRLYQVYEHSGLYGEAFHDITLGNDSVAGITGSLGNRLGRGLRTWQTHPAGPADAMAHTSP